MKRIKALDSLRGIAALIVLFAQCYSIWPEEARHQLAWLNRTPLRLFINGHAAVTLFFVLSGFVLALPFFHGKNFTYWQFALRRLCRIYIPFAAAIIFAWLLFLFSGGAEVESASLWFNEKWRDGFTAYNILLHLGMTGRVQDMALNHNMWTLVHEIRVSLLFPFLIALCANSRRAMISGTALFIFCTTAMVALRPATDEFFIDTKELWLTFLITGRCIAFFMVGILLAKHQDKISEKLAALPKWSQWGLWAFCLIVLIAPHYPEEDIPQGLVAALAIMLVMAQPKLGEYLSKGATVWLGRVSYSLYLTHLPILFMLFHLLSGCLPFGAIALIGIVASLSFAELMYRLVERPAMQLARRLTN